MKDLFSDCSDKVLEHFKDALLYALARVEVEIQRRKRAK